MIVHTKTALLVLAGLCSEAVAGENAHVQSPLKSAKEKAKLLAACPAYEHYARFPQYVFCPYRQSSLTDVYTARRTPKAQCHSLSNGQHINAALSNQPWWRRSLMI